MRRAPRPPIGLILFSVFIPTAVGQDAPPGDVPRPGRIFTVAEPIGDTVLRDLEAVTRQYLDRARTERVEPTLIFEIIPKGTKPGETRFGSALDLATLFSRKLGGAKRRVSYVPDPLPGYAGIAALACDELVMGESAEIGPLAPPDEPLTDAIREAVRAFAADRSLPPDLLLGMLQPDLDLRRVRTTDGTAYFVLAGRMEEFRKTHEIQDDASAWDGGSRGVITAQRAREWGLSKRTVGNRRDLAALYGLRGSTGDDPTLGQSAPPIWVRLDGPIDAVKVGHVTRQIAKARDLKANLLILELNSQGGVIEAADELADTLTHLEGIKTVAYINDAAANAAAMVAFACDEIVIRKDGHIGPVQSAQASRLARGERLAPEKLKPIADRLEVIAEQNGHNPAIARAMADASAIVVDARDLQTGATVPVLQDRAQQDPQRYQILSVRKPAGKLLTLSGDEALAWGLAYAAVADDQEFQHVYGLTGQQIHVAQPTWVDTLVTTLNTPWMSWLLLFIGMFMLVVELKLPGIGLPAITSALAFLLFFWSRYLSGTADQLEIILFLAGLIALALELFVFPGIGVFGMSGILLILVSIVMASHTFVWPSNESEYREMGGTLLRVVGAMVAVGVGIAIFARFFPSIPYLNRLILVPEPAGVEEIDPVTGKPIGPTEASYVYLMGETGRTTTTLRPAGKARFGELLIDVVADGGYVEPNSLVEVIEVQGTRVIVKRA